MNVHSRGPVAVIPTGASRAVVEAKATAPASLLVEPSAALVDPAVALAGRSGRSARSLEVIESCRLALVSAARPAVFDVDGSQLQAAEARGYPDGTVAVGPLEGHAADRMAQCLPW
ncbi:MAG: hypothetical protein EOO28_13240 [Comamonadaceae bacterium]|nr:MAG: hypothetical protein EOO28_13240 [Comamonadaceae bacterium]